MIEINKIRQIEAKTLKIPIYSYSFFYFLFLALAIGYKKISYFWTLHV